MSNLVCRRTYSQVRPFEIVHRFVVQIGDAVAGLVNQLSDMGELLELGLIHGISNAVIVRVKKRREEDDRDSFRGIAVMIAETVDTLSIGRLCQLIIDGD